MNIKVHDDQADPEKVPREVMEAFKTGWDLYPQIGNATGPWGQHETALNAALDTFCELLKKNQVAHAAFEEQCLARLEATIESVRKDREET